MNKIDDERVRDTCKDALDTRAENLDAATLSRLRQARVAALEQPTGWRRWLSLPRLLPAGGLATAAALVLAFNLYQAPPEPGVAPINGGIPHDNVAGGEDLELLQDMEFFEWLETQEQADRHA